MRKLLWSAVAGIAVAGSISLSAADTIWIEGESAQKTNLKKNPWLKGDNPKLLSGGDALDGLEEKGTLPKPSYAVWKFDVAKPGLYHVYFRHGFQGHLGAMKYRFIKADADGKPLAKPAPDQGWIEFDLDSPVMDQISTGQWRSVEWTRQAPVQLEQGTYLLDLQVTGAHPEKTKPSDPIWVLIDAICLTTEPFTPRGALKPGEKPGEGGGAAAGAAGDSDYY